MKSAGNRIRGRHPATPRALILVATLRLICFTVAVCVSLFALAFRSVRAHATEVLWGVGDRLMAYPGAPHEGLRHLDLNGARISFRTQTVDAALGDVLDYYESTCDVRDASLTDQLNRLLVQYPNRPANSGELRAISTVANRDDDSGYVACLDLGFEPRDLDALADSFMRFIATGNLGEVGELRHVFASRVSHGSPERTFLLTMWAESELNLYRMLPIEGFDAAGRDLAGVPRPPASQRVLSVSESEEPSGAVVYRVPRASMHALMSFYRRELQRRGWGIIESNASQSMKVDEVRLLSAEKGERQITVLSSASRGSESLLTILATEPT